MRHLEGSKRTLIVLSWRKKLDFNKFLKSDFYGKDMLVAGALSFIYIFPLILANVYYQDDILRASFGEEGWISDGRPFSAFIMMILEGHYILADIAPLGLILSVIVLACAGTVIARVMFPEDERWLVRAVIASLTCMSPFYLGNLSFRYDALPMSVTQYISIIVPILHINNNIKKISLDFLAMIFILCTYQACINTFISMSLLYSIIKARREDNIINSFYYFIKTISVVLFSSVIYTIIASNFIKKTSYAGAHSGIISLDGNILSTSFSNFTHGFHLVNLVLSEPLAWVIVIIYFIGIYYNFIVFNEKLYYYKVNDKFLCIFYMISPILFPILIIGYTIFLKTPVFEPRALPSVCVLLYFSFFSFLDTSKLRRIWTHFAIAASFIFLFSFSYSYGNALHIHSESENTEANEVMSLLRLKGFEQSDDLVVTGKQVEPNIVITAERIHPLFTVLIRPILPGDGYFVPLILRQTVSFKWPWKGIRHHIQPSAEKIKTCQNILMTKEPIYKDDRISMYKDGKIWCLNNISHLESFSYKQ